MNNRQGTLVSILFTGLFTGIFIIFFSIRVSADTAVTKPSSIGSVNGVAISRSEFDAELEQIKMGYMQQGRDLAGPELEKVKDAVIEILINRELLFQESQRLGILPEEKEVAEQLATIKEKFPSEAEFKKALEAMNFEEKDVSEHIKKALSIQKMIEQEIIKKIQVTDQASKDYYDKNPQSFKQPEQVKASHILIKVDPAVDAEKKAEARKKIEGIQKELKEGKEFSALAKEHSEDPSAPQGGDLGYFRRGQMVKPFEDAAFGLKKDEISDIVETSFGYHLIKVYDKKPERTVEYPEAKEKIAEYLKQEKAKEEVKLFVKKLRDQADVKKTLS
jgi:peptidyl-prolyl cis-trans isomerase C